MIPFFSRIFFPSLVIVLISVSQGIAGGGKTYGDVLNAEYVRAVNGSVIIMNLPGMHPLIGKEIPVRIKGIEVPQPAANCPKERLLAGQARDIVDWLLKKADHISLRNVQRDRSFRIVAVVYADGKDIREVLLKKELARRLSDKKKIDWCK